MKFKHVPVVIMATLVTTFTYAQEFTELTSPGPATVKSDGNLSLSAKGILNISASAGGGNGGGIAIRSELGGLSLTSLTNINLNGMTIGSSYPAGQDIEVAVPDYMTISTEKVPRTLGNANLSNYKLYVGGGVLAEEVRVRTGWADYVFDDSYTLKPLPELETYIQTHNHLPNVPSATQVEEEGIEIGDITRIQQEKIEELTLYILQLHKKMEALEAKFNAQHDE